MLSNVYIHKYKFRINKMKTQDWVIIGAVTLLILLHFYLPFVQDNEGLHSAFFALKYTNIHWGFYYFYLVLPNINFFQIIQKPLSIPRGAEKPLL